MGTSEFSSVWVLDARATKIVNWYQTMDGMKQENSQIKARRMKTALSRSPSTFSKAYAAILPFCASRMTSSSFNIDKATETGRGPFSKTLIHSSSDRIDAVSFMTDASEEEGDIL